MFSHQFHFILYKKEGNQIQAFFFSPKVEIVAKNISEIMLRSGCCTTAYSQFFHKCQQNDLGLILGRQHIYLI